MIGLGWLNAAADAALMTLGRHKIPGLAEEYPAQKNALELWERDPDHLLSSIAVGKTISVAGIVVAVMLVLFRLTDANDWNIAIPGMIGFVVSIFLILVFTKMLPRLTTRRSTEASRMRLLGFLYILDRVGRPVTALFVGISRAIAGKGNGKGDARIFPLAEAGAVTAGEDDDIDTINEQKMINSIFELGDTMAREVMVPRPDMKCVSVDATLDEILDVMIGGGYSRVPMYETDLDSIVGVLYAKDLLKFVGKGEKEIALRELARPAHFIPETKKVDDLFRELQAKKIHLAITVDEYGGTAGLITIEDLLEEIVGEIFDEFDSEESLIERVKEGTYRLDARYPLDDLPKLLGVELPTEGEIDSVGGLVFSEIGRVPRPGDEIIWEGLRLVVERVLGRRVHRVLVERATDSVVERAKNGSSGSE